MISKPLVETILRYLMTKPYGEVYQIINAVQQEVKQQPPVDTDEKGEE